MEAHSFTVQLLGVPRDSIKEYAPTTRNDRLVFEGTLHTVDWQLPNGTIFK